ncbi:MAG: membrane protein insertion efficiency factor YidD [Clostridia bacterium]|nr:membrane protein insertion efficiency factor YidD [Clostridia bacterium]
MKHIIVFFISVYQRMISPFLPKSCRFEPTCSTYCKEAVIKYGAIKGSWLCIKRVKRCHPWNPGGYDPLP